jgi:hypothetical protein
MQSHTHVLSSVFRKGALVTAALSGFFFFAGTPSAKAADRDDCERRIARIEWRLHEAIEDHGYYSRQAKHWRHELREEYERCYRDRDRYDRRYYRDHDEDYDEYHRDRDYRY